jgi:hypothetical protein
LLQNHDATIISLLPTPQLQAGEIVDTEAKLPFLSPCGYHLLVRAPLTTGREILTNTTHVYSYIMVARKEQTLLRGASLQQPAPLAKVTCQDHPSSFIACFPARSLWQWSHTVHVSTVGGAFRTSG